jgi:hypothetical protein
VFASAIGTPLDAANVRREFRKITEAAGLGAGWAPLDLRRTFVSLMSADGVPIEEIARLAGHNRAAAELVALGFDTHNIAAGCGDRFPPRAAGRKPQFRAQFWLTWLLPGSLLKLSGWRPQKPLEHTRPCRRRAVLPNWPLIENQARRLRRRWPGVSAGLCR